MLSVVCFKWRPQPHYRTTFGPETVNVLKRMVARQYGQPHRFICMTDDPAGIDPDVEVLPIWQDFADLPSPHGIRNVSCYRRLRMFSRDVGAVLGDRFVTLDLDCILTGDLRPLWDRPEDLVCWGDTNPRPGSHYNGSMMLLRAGARPQVWEQFDPRTSPKLSLRAGCWGSDQGWISYVLGPGEARWSTRDGVYSWRIHLDKNGRCLPSDAKAVFFHGRIKPWGPEMKGIDWCQEHWQ